MTLGFRVSLHFSALYCRRLTLICQHHIKPCFPGRMMSSTTPGSDGMDQVKEIFGTALESVKPLQMVKNSFHFCHESQILQVGRGTHQMRVDLNGKRCHVAAYGKAVIGMVTAVESVLGERVKSGIASIPTNIINELKLHGREDLLPKSTSHVRLCEGAHLNIPDKACLKTSTDIMDLATGLTKDDVLVTLTSGGGSALLSLPVPPLTLQDIITTTKSLAKAGADIVELNTVRKHLEVLKGGGLARIAYPAQVVNLILSDVVGDPIDCIASGPTVRDTSTSKDAVDIVKRLLSPNQLPTAVMEVLSSDAKANYLSSMDNGNHFPDDYVHNVIIGSNTIALDSAVRKCQSMDITAVTITSRLCGTASQVGIDMAKLAHRIVQRDVPTQLLLDGLFTDTQVFSDGLHETLSRAVTEARETKRSICLLFGGETTVEVKGKGKGGRNQEMCLSAMMEFSSLHVPPEKVTFASVGTDGQDGPTDAAGAIVTPDSLSGNGSDNDPQKSLENNDSYTFFSKLNNGRNLVMSGLTGTNVMDISILHISGL